MVSARWPRFLSGLRPGSYGRDALMLVPGTALAQLLTLAATPVLSRLYPPEAFGVLAVFGAVCGIVAVFVTLRYETTILLPEEDAEAIALVHASLAATLSFGGLLFLCALVLPDALARALCLAPLAGWLPAAVVAGVATALTAIATAWLNRKRAYRKLVVLRLALSLGVAGLAMVLAVFAVAAGMLYASLLAICVVAVASMLLLPRAPWRREPMLAAARGRASVPGYLLPTAMLDTVTLQLPVLLLAAWFGTRVAGQFSMAWKILALPMGLIGAATAQVFMQRFARTWPDAAAARQLLFRTWGALALFGIVPALVMAFSGESAFVWMFGESWRPAGQMAEILTPMLLVMLVSSPTSGAFLVLGLQRYSFVFGLLVLAYRPACLALGLVTGNLLDGLRALVLAEILQTLLYQWVVIRRIGATA